MKKAKNLRTRFRILVFISIFWCTTVPLQAQVLPKLLQGSSLTTQNLNTSQLANYQNLANREFVSSVSLITLNSLAGSSDNGEIKAQLPGSSCGEVTFKTKIAEYVSENNYLWEGELKTLDTCGCTDGYFVLESQNGRKLGHITLDDDYYEIREIGGGQYALAAFSFENWTGVECTVGNDTSEFTSPVIVGNRDESHCVIRVLILYNQTALSELGSNNAMNDLIFDAWNQMKISLQNSAVTEEQLKLELAGIQAINFTQILTDPYLEIVENLSTNSTIMALRDATEADVVAYITGDDYFLGSYQSAGASGGPGADESLAYFLVEQEFATSRHTFAHELAHIFNCRHDFLADDTPGIMHGFKFDIGRCREKMRKTIMQSLEDGKHRISHFSNPSVAYGGSATGTSDRENNAEQLRSTACTVADFRVSNDELVVTIAGSKIGCPCNTTTLTANLSGGPSGTYAFEWSISEDGGINYGGIESTTSTLQTEFPCPDEGIFKVRLKVTDPNSVVVYKYVNITASNNPPNEEQCGHGGHLIGGGDSKLLKDNIAVYPNPTSGKVNIVFKKEVAGLVFARINTLESNTIWHGNLGYFEIGQNSVEIPIEKLSSGFYSVTLLDDEGIRTTKMVVNNN
ncbi:MAG: hypothetical protein K9J37_18130 [Saprospiraceae bacterium]|nr:hypothetical protein [Saprospiraceae bacterium]MCF8251838.1 hypothetical protein [Saprospiraceae bacterium]MCF8281953.1 hypothetical protein [Bacteroidales bacterium]MCF8313312.1 hypothetical protein [Saprospiraceae bacterium]MCF8441732.1 hypothetical protein [Saprospiraceae bacterium]